MGCLYDNTTLSAPPQTTAPSGPTLSSPAPNSATALAFDWGGGGPSGTAPDTFSVRWKGNFNFNAGTYTFTVGADDGVRLKIDGSTQIDDWGDHGYRESSKSVTLTGGTHLIEVEYYENGWAARVEVRWSGITPPTITSITPFCDGTTSRASITFTGTPGNFGGFYVDIDRDGDWGNGFFNRFVSATTTGTHTVSDAPAGFQPLEGESGTLTFTPGNTYRVRVYNGQHSSVQTFTASNCGVVCDATQVGSNQLVGCLYDNTTLSGSPQTAPSGPTLSSPVPSSATALAFDWGLGGPSGTAPDTFSIRWKGNFTFTAGTYTFTVGADDGVRLKVDGTTQIDDWSDHGYREGSKAVTLTGGTHLIEVEYYESVGGARVEVRWATVSTLSVTCSASPNPANSGQTVTWMASPLGGTGSYSYSWSGDDGLTGSSQSVSKTYTNSSSSPITKSATVTVTSGSQQASNSCSVTINGVTPPSDLIIQNPVASPNSGPAGSTTTVSFTLRNQGSGTANSSTTNIRINTSASNVTTSDPLLISISIPSIGAGGTYNVSQPVTIPTNRPTGTNYIWVIADVYSTANQSDETNDKAYTSFTVSPTFSVTGVSIDINPEDPTPVQQGGTVTGNGTISGTGSGTVQYSWIVRKPGGVYWNSPLLSTTMNSGSANIPSYSGFPTSDPGQHWVWVRIQSPNFTESNTEYYTVNLPPVELRIDGGTSSTRPQLQTFTFTGFNYTPNRTVTRYMRKPDGSTITLTPTLSADSGGNISWTYASVCSTPTGTYTLWVVDDATGRTSNTVTETITANPSCSQPPTNRLLNPSFESGSANWVQYSSSGFFIITNSTAASARTGSWYAWFGSENSLTEYIYQDVTIPASATQASVEFWYQVSTAEASSSSCYDKLVVEVRRPSDNTLLATLGQLCNYNQTTTWTRSGPFNILSFKGQTVRLRFYMTTDGSYPSSFFVDDVALMADGS